jgi:hypothetical protein
VISASVVAGDDGLESVDRVHDRLQPGRRLAAALSGDRNARDVTPASPASGTSRSS